MAKRVFIIDDETSNVERLTSQLTAAGYDVTSTDNGEKAIKDINMNNAPHLIISNDVLPDMHSFHIFKELKSEPRTKNIPAIILTNTDSLDKQFLDLDIKEHFKKPVDVKALLGLMPILLKYGSRDKIPKPPKFNMTYIIVAFVFITLMFFAIILIGVNNIPFLKK